MELTRDELIERAERILGVTLLEWQRECLYKAYRKGYIGYLSNELHIMMPKDHGRYWAQMLMYATLLSDTKVCTDEDKTCVIAFKDTGEESDASIGQDIPRNTYNNALPNVMDDTRNPMCVAFEDFVKKEINKDIFKDPKKGRGLNT